jgi:hypothetical protein
MRDSSYANRRTFLTPIEEVSLIDRFLSDRKSKFSLKGDTSVNSQRSVPRRGGEVSLKKEEIWLVV